MIAQWLGSDVPYEDGLKLQEEHVRKIQSGDASEALFLMEHSPVYTIGRTRDQSSLGQAPHLPHPVFEINRGGQATYHGPGQLVVYLLLDLARRNLGVRQLVSLIEDTLISLLSSYGVRASTMEQVPGVFVGRKKIGFLGLRVRRGKTYHGFSLNIDMDLAPFKIINPCGYEGLEVTDLKALGKNTEMKVVVDDIKSILDVKLRKIDRSA